MITSMECSDTVHNGGHGRIHRENSFHTPDGQAPVSQWVMSSMPKRRCSVHKTTMPRARGEC